MLSPFGSQRKLYMAVKFKQDEQEQPNLNLIDSLPVFRLPIKASDSDRPQPALVLG